MLYNDYSGNVEKQVYSADLKSAGASHGGSTPPIPTKSQSLMRD